VRLFFAVELPASVRDALGRLRPADDRDYRWVDPAQLHVTLAFLGEQPEAALASLEQIGTTAASSSSVMTLKLGAAGSFGPRRAPRVLWVGFDGDIPRLLRLQAALTANLSGAGFATEDREFRPHVTLARRRPTASSQPLAWPPSATPRHAFAVAYLTLFQSRLSPSGAAYIRVAQFELAKAF
jgi:2'-5' RNA ligase